MRRTLRLCCVTEGWLLDLAGVVHRNGGGAPRAELGFGGGVGRVMRDVWGCSRPTTTGWSLPHTLRAGCLRGLQNPAYAVVRSIGKDTEPDTMGGRPSEMELADFAAAIPDHQFSFIVFEACLMAGVVESAFLHTVHQQ